MQKQYFKENMNGMNNKKDKNRINHFQAIKNTFSIMLLLIVVGLSVTACQANPDAKAADNGITARKTIETANKNIIADVSEQEQQTVGAAVVNFHRLFNQKKFEEIYALLDETGKPLLAKQEFIKMLDQLYTRLGKVEKTNLVGIREERQKDVRTVEILYNTEFEQKTHQEKFRWVIGADGKAKLYSYSQPPQTIPVPIK